MNQLLNESQCFSDFFQKYCSEMQNTKRYFSLRQLSKKMGYKTPSLLSDIINKKRNATLDVVERLKTVAKLSPLEEQYLKNLIAIETTTSEELKALKIKENELIRDCWKGHESLFHPPDEFSSLDPIIMTIMSTVERITEQQVIEEYKGMIPASTVSERLQMLIKNNFISKDEEGYLTDSGQGTFTRMEQGGFKQLADFLSRGTSDTRRGRQQAVVSLYLTKDGFEKAKEIMRVAVDQIYMVGMDECKYEPEGPKEVYTFYSTLFQTTGTQRTAPLKTLPVTKADA